MLAQQPVALALVASQHLPLGVEHPRDIDPKVDRHAPAVAVPPLHGMNEIKMGNLREHRRRVPLPGHVVGA